MSDKKRRLFLEYATHAETGENVVPQGTSLMGDDGTTRCYDPVTDYMRLQCPGCSISVTHVRESGPGAGDTRKKVSAHLRSLEDHHVWCDILQEYLHGRYPSQKRTINPNKAPFFYINTGQDKHRPSSIPRDVTTLPPGIQRVTYAKSNHNDHRIIDRLSDMSDRPREMPVNGALAMVHLIRHATQKNINPMEMWGVNRGVAIQLSKLFLDATKGPVHNHAFERLLNDLDQGIKHPVFLQFPVHEIKYFGEGDKRLRVRLSDLKLSVPNPKAGQGVELPTIPVDAYIHVREPSLFPIVSAAKDDPNASFFVMAHPYAFRATKRGDRVRLHFDVVRARDMVKMVQSETGLEIHEIMDKGVVPEKYCKPVRPDRNDHPSVAAAP